MTIALTATTPRDAHREIARVVALTLPGLGRALAALADASRMSQDDNGMGHREPFAGSGSLSK